MKLEKIRRKIGFFWEDFIEDLIAGKVSIYEKVAALVALYGLRVLLALITLVVGFWVIKHLTNFLMKSLEQKNFDPTIRVYMGRILSVALKVMLLFSVAGMIGIQTTSFMAVLGAAGLAVGLALQGSLSNFAGGVLMMILRPFQVGDFIIAQGEEGTVTAIDIFNTTLLKTDYRRVIIPNGPLIGGTIVNASAERLRRVEVTVGIAYKDSLAAAQNALLKMAEADPRVVQDPPPMVGITSFGDSSVNIVFRVWCLNAAYWDVYHSMYQKTKEVFDANGITIPFPQREVRNFVD